MKPSERMRPTISWAFYKNIELLWTILSQAMAKMPFVTSHKRPLFLTMVSHGTFSLEKFLKMKSYLYLKSWNLNMTGELGLALKQATDNIFCTLKKKAKIVLKK